MGRTLALVLFLTGAARAQQASAPEEKKKVVASAPDVDLSSLGSAAPAAQPASDRERRRDSDAPQIQQARMVPELTEEGKAQIKRDSESLGDLPGDVKNNILYGKSYGEGEMLPSEPLTTGDRGVSSPVPLDLDVDKNMPVIPWSPTTAESQDL